MHNKFLSYIKEEKLFNKSDKILLAVSGGMDSMTLCEMLRINRFEFGLAHFNHVTRNGESDLDEDFVRKYALKNEIPFFTQRKDINKLIELENGGNFQSMARMHRYDWLNRLRISKRYDYIATAHHHNDQIETFLFHFSRGTGLDGLSGISSKQDYLIRPMLIFTRKEIESYVFENKLEYRVDSSNASSKYSRNYIRHGIIPSFNILNDNFENNANTTIENLRSTKNLYTHLIKEYCGKYIHKGKNGALNIDSSCFNGDTQINKQLCFEIVRQFGFNFHHACQIMESLDQRGKIFYSNDFELLIENNKIIIRRKAISTKVHLEISDSIHIPGFGTLLLESMKAENDYTRGQNIEYIDAHKIDFPLIVRNKEDGDRFKPLGMKGRSKKLKDFFTDLKLSKFEKERILVVLDNDRVVWVLGYRLSDHFKITAKTKEVLKLEWIPEQFQDQ